MSLRVREQNEGSRVSMELPEMPDNLADIRIDDQEEQHQQQPREEEEQEPEEPDSRRQTHRDLMREQETDLEVDQSLDMIVNTNKVKQRLADVEDVAVPSREEDDPSLHISLSDLPPLPPRPHHSDDRPHHSDERPYDDAPRDEAPTREEIKKAKTEMDKMLADLEVWSKGYKEYIPRKFTHTSNPEEVRSVHNKIKAMRTRDSGLKITRKLLIGFVGGIEWLNHAYDPLGLKLDDWSQEIESDIEDYDDVLVRIWERYGRYLSESNPLIELMVALSMSAAMYHLSQQWVANQVSQQQQQQEKEQQQQSSRQKRHVGRKKKKGASSSSDDEPIPTDQEDYVRNEPKRKPKKPKQPKPPKRPPSPPKETNVRGNKMGGMMGMMNSMLGSGGMSALAHSAVYDQADDPSLAQALKDNPPQWQDPPQWEGEAGVGPSPDPEEMMTVSVPSPKAKKGSSRAKTVSI
jgi:uncharacterized protein DUF5767